MATSEDRIQKSDAEGSGEGASVKSNDVLFYKNIKYKIEDLLKITTKEQLEKVLGVKITSIGDWGINEDGYLWYTSKPSFKKDIATYIKFKDKNNKPYYLSTDEPSTFPFHTKTYDEIVVSKKISVEHRYSVGAAIIQKDGPASIPVTIQGSIPNLDDLVSITNLNCRVIGQITYPLADGTFFREGFDEFGSIDSVSNSWTVYLTIKTSKNAYGNPIVSIKTSSATLNYQEITTDQITYCLALHDVGYARRSADAYWWDDMSWSLGNSAKFDVVSSVVRDITNDANQQPAIQRWTPSNFKINGNYPQIYSYYGNKDQRSDGNQGQLINMNNSKATDGPKWDNTLYGENSYFGAKDGNWIIPLFTNENIKDSDATETKIDIKKNEVLIGNKSYFFPKKSKLILFRRYTTQTPIVDKKFGIYWQTDYASKSDPVWFWAVHYYGRNNYDPNNIMAPKKYSPGFFCGAVNGPGIAGTGYDRSCALASLSSAYGGGSYYSKYTPDAAPAESIISIKIDSYKLDYALIELDANTTTISLSNNTNMSALEWKNVNKSNFSSLKSMENQVVKSYPPERDAPVKAKHTVAQYINKYVTRSEMTSWTDGGSSSAQFSNWTLNSGNYFEFKFNNIPYMSCFHNRNFTRECNVSDEAGAMEADDADTTYQFTYAAVRWNITDVVGGLFPGSVDICTIDQNVSGGKKTVYYKENGKDCYGELLIDYTNHNDNAGVYLYNHLLYNKNTKYTYWVAVVGPDWKGN